MDSHGDINDLGDQYIGGNATIHSSDATPAFALSFGLMTWITFAVVAVLS